MSHISLAALALLLVLSDPARAGTVEEVETCMKENLPDQSSVQSVLFRSTNRVGDVSESKAKIYWQRSENGRTHVMVRFRSPRDLRGAGLLMLAKGEGRPDMFIYLPELEKVRRVTSRMMSGSMFGTDFSYEEFERFQGFEEGWSTERLDDQVIDDAAVHVVASSPAAPGESSYERIVQYVDAETCVPVRTEFYEPGDKLRKVASFDRESVVKEKSGWLPHSVSIRDLRDETHTDLVIEEIEIDEKIPKKYFSQRHLESGSH